MPKTTPRTQSNQNLTSEQYRALAEHAAGQEANQRTRARKDRAKRAAGVPQNRWATDQQVKVAGKAEAAARKDTPTQRPDRDQLVERQRQAMIRDRNRRRRLPWYGTGATVLAGLAGHGVVTLFESTTAVSGTVPGLVFAAVPALGAGVTALRTESHHQHRRKLAQHQSQDAPDPSHRRWAPELAAGGAGAAALAYWIARAGLSWPVVLAALVGTIACGWRWWRANPIGPRVAPLQPPQPAQPDPTPAPEPQEPVDDFARDWAAYCANKNRGGKAPGSRLTNRDDTDYITTYDAELARGSQTPNTLRQAIAELASGLAIRASQLLIEDDPHERGEHIAKVTIVRHDPVADTRYYTGPNVTATDTDGIVHGAGRYGDGCGELDLVMWNDAGMVPTAIIGATRSGKSCVGNIAVDGMLSTGVMNMIYIDPKTISSPEMSDIARVVILGQENAARAPELVNAILGARRDYGAQHRMAKMNPTAELPGWGVIHDEFSELVNHGYRKQALQWTSLVNTLAAFGMWPVAMNQSMLETKWGDDQCRGAFASQMVVMRMRTYSGKLIPGLELHPASLPNRKGIGVYVHDDAARSNVPVQFDYIPEPKEAHKHPDAPLTTKSAFGMHTQPGMLDSEYAAIVSVLGEPNADGRWIVGGPFGTHEFPSADGSSSSGADTSDTAGQKTTGGWGAQLAAAANGSDTGEVSSERRVYELIAAGTTTRKSIVRACQDRMSEATVDRALDTLVGDGHVHRPEGTRGAYAVTTSTPGTD